MTEEQPLDDRMAQLLHWGRRVSDELSQLPDTLERLREGVANFELVTRRLADGTETLEQLNNLYRTGAGETVRRYAEAADAVRSQLDQIQPGKLPTDLVDSTMTELNRTLGALADMNPFWRGGGRARPTGPSDPPTQASEDE